MGAYLKPQQDFFLVGFTTIKNSKYNDNNFGIGIYQSSNDNIYNNFLKSNRVAVYIAGGSINNHIHKNIIANNTFGFVFADTLPSLASLP